MKTILVICSLLLLIALFPLPSIYYFLLRVIITIAAVIALYLKNPERSYLWDAVFIAVAILFNPIVPIYLYSKALWMPIDVLTCSFFMAYIYRKPNF